jgi:hypothetical protein
MFGAILDIPSLFAAVYVTHSHVTVYLGITNRFAQAHERHLVLVFGPLANILPHHESVTYWV